MRTTNLFHVLALIASLALTGCFAVNDLDGFTTAVSCDLDFTGINFSPHRDQLFRFDVIETIDSVPVEQPAAIVVFEPLGDPNFRINIPNAVPAPVDVGQNYALEFFGDLNFDGTASQPGDDHTWRIEENLCAGPIEFLHNVEFQDVQSTVRDAGPELVLDFSCDAESIGPDDVIEVRVTGHNFVDGLDVTGGIAFYRRAGPLRDATSIGIDGVFISDQQVDIEVIFDRANEGTRGVADGGEVSLRYTNVGPAGELPVSCGGRTTPMCDATTDVACFQPETEDPETPGSRIPSEIRLFVSANHTDNIATPFETSWWEPME